MEQKIYTGVQILAGLMLIMFGLNKFLHFIPMPPPPEAMGAYLGALFQAGFIFPLIAVIYILVGISFILNKFAPLMAIILMPVILNALLAHLFLDPAGMGAALLLSLLTLIIMYRHKITYQALFKA